MASLLAFALGAPVSAAADDLGALLERFARRPHGHATFVETQYLAMLKRPLESRGELFFDAPDRLEKRTLSPKPETLVVEHGLLTIERSSRRHVVALSAYPQIGLLIDSIRATLAGDRASLESVYAIELTAGEPDWVLHLSPHDPQLAALVRRITIEGRGDTIRRIEAQRPGGDHSVTSITPLDSP